MFEVGVKAGVDPIKWN